ncbi:hypothetical protein SAMN05444157_2592 [Frankineae bacterium MT45]|nr:hypothetical protein SAMN05444157_2592 [Frankineae bacterium MT45]
MARALLGYVGSGSEQLLVLEAAQLRRRVQALEAEVAQLRAQLAEGLDSSMDLELHRFTEAAEPVLA